MLALKWHDDFVTDITDITESKLFYSPLSLKDQKELCNSLCNACAA